MCEGEREKKMGGEGGRKGGNEFNSRTVTDEANLYSRHEDMFN